MPDPEDLTSAYDVALHLKPLVDALKAAAWEVNIAIEWRDGERFSLAGRLPPPPDHKPDGE